MFLDAKVLHGGMNSALVMHQILVGQFPRGTRFNVIEGLVGFARSLLFKLIFGSVQQVRIGNQSESGRRQNMGSLKTGLVANTHAVTGRAAPLMRRDMQRP